MICPDCKKPAELIVNGFSSRLTYYFCKDCKLAVEDKDQTRTKTMSLKTMKVSLDYNSGKMTWDTESMICHDPWEEKPVQKSQNQGSNPPDSLL